MTAIAAPAKPHRFMKRLKKLDPKLDLEYLGEGRWCVIDTSRPLGEYRIKKGIIIGNEERRTIYDRIYHIPEGYGEPDGGVLETLRSMRMERWGKPADLKRKLYEDIEKAEHARLSPEKDFAEDVASQVKNLKRFSVPVNGRKGETRDNPGTAS